MKKQIIAIEHLLCQYKNGQTVLYVESFSLYSGEIVFLLGPSGIGKSTFIEAIGLINNTGSKSSDTIATYILGSGEKIDLINLWDGNFNQLESFRRDHFSYIFQNNYLMPNLTAGENMMLTLLMKGENEISARQKIKELMHIVKLNGEVFDQKIFNVSGGQKQRLAFVRAIASPFEVLIGDEPTGNLDSLTAKALMTFTRESIINTNKAGIFVSHDIQLALKYADRIYMLIPKQTDDGLIGYLSEKTALSKHEGEWYNKEQILNDAFNYVSSVFREIV